MAKQLAKELINAGVHFGHGVSRWHPKMAPYIFDKRGKIHIIDVRKTLEGILIAKKLLAEIVSTNKDVVFVGTKRQAHEAVQKAAAKCGMHYVSERWLGGMLTNFRTVRSRLQRLEELEKMQETGTLESESKKQASRLKREMRKIKTNLEGVRNMSRLPGVIVVVDTKKEYLALAEARKLDIPTIGLIDTNSDPDAVDVAIPANDDSIRAINLILDQLADAVAIGKTMITAQQSTDVKPTRTRSKRQTLASAEPQQKQQKTPEKPEPAKTEEKPQEKTEPKQENTSDSENKKEDDQQQQATAE